MQFNNIDFEEVNNNKNVISKNILKSYLSLSIFEDKVLKYVIKIKFTKNYNIPSRNTITIGIEKIKLCISRSK